MARIEQVIHVKYDGEVRECALFDSASDIPSPATAREFALNGAKIYGAVLGDDPALDDDAAFLLGESGTELAFHDGSSSPRLLTTPYFIRPKADSIEVGADGGQFYLTDIASSNGSVADYGFSDSFLSRAADGSGFAVAANTTTSARTFTVTLTYSFADGSTRNMTFTGTQAAAAAEPWLTVTPSSVTLSSNGATAEVEVDSSSDWTVSADQTWVSVSPTSGGGGVSVMTLRAMYPATGLPVRCHLTVTNADGLEAAVRVSQGASATCTLTVNFSSSSSYVPTLTVEGTRDGAAVTETAQGSAHATSTYTGKFDRDSYVRLTYTSGNTTYTSAVHMDGDQTVAVTEDGFMTRD